MPVSYTHLDVYKRQKQAREHTLKERALGNLNEQQAYERGADSIPPVSYTHLQIWFIFWMTAFPA